MFKKENIYIHLVYVILILSFLIIGLVTQRLVKDTTAVDYISFASTITALILALLAIIFAYISNYSIQTSISKMSSESNEITKNAAMMTSISKVIEDKIGKIPGLIEGVRERVEVIPEKMRDIMNVSGGAAAEEEERVKEIEEAIGKYLMWGSLMSKLIMYAMAGAYRNQLAIDVNELAKEVRHNGGSLIDYDYCLGFALGFQALGLLSINMNRAIWNIIYMNEKLMEGINDSLKRSYEEYVEWFKKEYSREPDKNLIEAIDGYLNINI